MVDEDRGVAVDRHFTRYCVLRSKDVLRPIHKGRGKDDAILIGGPVTIKVQTHRATPMCFIEVPP